MSDHPQDQAPFEVDQDKAETAQEKKAKADAEAANKKELARKAKASKKKGK